MTEKSDSLHCSPSAEHPVGFWIDEKLLHHIDKALRMSVMYLPHVNTEIGPLRDYLDEDRRSVHKISTIVTGIVTDGTYAHSDRMQVIEAFDQLSMIRESLQRYHDALNNRQHGDVAAGKFAHECEGILNQPWVEKRK